jgi:light-regulated signal transduction histidine kinase (bacteriophytochrome)
MLRVKEAEEALLRSNEQLRRFAFVVSHELQEPLRMVKSYTQLLAQRYKESLGSEAAEYMQFTVAGVTRMEKFIHDMLSYSQAAEGEVDVKFFPCRTAVDWALMELESAVSESGATIEIGDLPMVWGDPMRLSHVFRNLIGNAMKYRADHPPTIRVSATEDADKYTICVQDNGIGIDPKYFDNIFILFKRLHGRERSGSGVGLAICKEIVEHHGGKIWVDSAPGAGSAFCFTLPKVAGEFVAATS